ncbi:MAG: TolC family protein [Gemmataceae bacterium]|jgi:cobalt-zinc-cadmium efflux system outer membrane protein|nr:TolC family protein [Gemmataceae bacterium]
MKRRIPTRIAVTSIAILSGIGGCASPSLVPDTAPPPVSVKPIVVPSRTPVPANHSNHSGEKQSSRETSSQEAEKSLFAAGYQDSKGKGEKISPAQAEIPMPKIDVPATKGLTFDQLINQVLLADPKLRAGIESIQQAEGDLVTSSLLPNPVFNASRTYLQLNKPINEENQGGPAQLDVGLGFPIDWFLFGKRAAAMQASRAGVRVSESEYANLIRQRILEASTGYYDLLEAKALYNLAKQDVENYRQVEALTRKAVDAGNRSLVELNRIRLDRLKSEQVLRDTEVSLVQAKAKLRILLGATESDPNFDVMGSLEEMRVSQPLDLNAAFEVASRNRPDIEALRLKIERSRLNLNVEQAKAYPDVIPKIGLSQQYQKAIGFPDITTWGVGLDLSLPIFDRNQGNRLKANSLLVQSSQELQAGLASLRGELEQVDKELRTAAENAKAVAEEQLKTAIQVRDVIVQAYTAGNRPLIDVLDAQRNFNETYRLFINTRANYHRALMKYQATLGQQIIPQP